MPNLPCETSRAVYNRAVAECTLGTYNIYRRAYTQHKPKSGRIYLDKKTYDMAKDMADTLDITVDEFNIESDLNHTVWYFLIRRTAQKHGIYRQITYRVARQ